MTPFQRTVWGLVFLAAAWASQAPRALTIRLEGEPPAFYVHHSAILTRINNPNFEFIFRVSVDKPDAPPIAGVYSIERGALVFRPKYPLEPGLSYRASFQLATERASGSFTPPKPKPLPTTIVEQVLPSAGVVPENLLKFYIHFSAPMSRGEGSRRIHLVEEGAGEVKLPFLEIDEELWDRDFRRLTVLFDPGRIKRGLAPAEEVGMALKEGGKYRLVIDAEWPDASGVPLKSAFAKQFIVGAADRTPLDPKQWQLMPPPAGTRDPLLLDFPEPLDSALLQRFLDVVDGKGNAVKGRITLDRNESRWLFTPEAPWAAGGYAVEVLKTLEDLAGNKIGRAFDVDRFEQVQKGPVSEIHSIPFSVGSQAAPSAPTPK